MDNQKLHLYGMNGDTPLIFCAEIYRSEQYFDSKNFRKVKDVMAVVEDIDECVEHILQMEEEGEQKEARFYFLCGSKLEVNLRMDCKTRDEAMYAVNTIAQIAYDIMDAYEEMEGNQ